MCLDMLSRISVYHPTHGERGLGKGRRTPCFPGISASHPVKFIDSSVDLYKTPTQQPRQAHGIETAERHENNSSASTRPKGIRARVGRGGDWITHERMKRLCAIVCVLRQDAFCRFRTWFTLEKGDLVTLWSRLFWRRRSGGVRRRRILPSTEIL